MDDKTETLIRELADKFGTTVEHLWGVLVKQAVIEGVYSLLLCVIWSAVCYASANLIRNLSNKSASAEGSQDPALSVDALVFSWIAWALVTLLVLCFVCTKLLYVGWIINPEYWALKQILP